MPQPKVTKITKHKCELKGSTRGLPPLAPNASSWMKLKRWIRLLSLLDEDNHRCGQFFATTSAMRNEFYRHTKSRYKCVIHPFSKLNCLMSLIFFISWGIQLWLLPVCYTTTLDIEDVLGPFLVCFIALVQCVPLISFFFIGYIKDKTKKIIIEPKMICKHYLKTFFIPDFIAVMGPVVNNVSPLSPTLPGIKGDLEFLYRYVVLCCYFVRLQSLKKTLKEILLVIRSSSAKMFVVNHLLTMTLMLHLMTSLVVTIPLVLYEDPFPVDSWFSQADLEDVTSAGIASVYVHGYLMTCCYFFGVSHGGYNIIMPNEEIILFLISLVGRLYTLYMIADLLRIFGLVNVSESRYENLRSQLNAYVRSLNVPSHLRSKLLKYCEYKFHGHYISEKEIFRTLPHHIKVELFLYDAKMMIQNIPVFQVIPREKLGALIGEMQRNFYSPGDKIEEQGGRIEEVHFINSGTVAIYDSDMEICHIQDGDSFGDIVQFITDWSNYQYTYIAVEFTDIYSLQRDKFIQLLREHEDVRKYFEVKNYRKLRMFENHKNSILRTNDIVSELRKNKILERPKVRPHYVPE